MPASRGRAPADIRDNQQNARGHLTFRQKQNAETRDLGLKRRGIRATSHALATQRAFSPQSRVCGVSLVVTNQGPMRVMLTGADLERARLRKSVTGKWLDLIDFCCFRRHPNAGGRPHEDNGRKLRKSIKRREAKVEGDNLTNRGFAIASTQSDCVPEMIRGREGAEEAKQSSQHPPRPRRSRSVLQTP